MTSNTSPTMSQVSHFSHRDSSFYPQYYYPSVPASPQRPPPAHTKHGRKPSEAQMTDSTRVKSSISSVESASTGISGHQHHSPRTYWQGSNAEQGLITEKSRSKSSPSLGNVVQKDRSRSPPKKEMAEDNSAVLKYIQQQRQLEASESDDEDDHAIWILFWLSFLDPIHSLISAIYTLLVVFTLTIAFPIRACKTQSSFGDQLIRILAPIFRNHLDMLYAPSVDDAYTFEFKPVVLIMVHLGSPFLSLGVMLSAWVAAAFWLFAIVMGNPDGTENGDDGRNTVLSVRNWWERLLLKAVEGR